MLVRLFLGDYMSLTNTSTRYGTVSIALHWVMFLLIVAVYACIELRELYPKGSDTRNMLKDWHFTLGLCVFALVWLRLLLRVLQPIPAVQPPLGKVQHWLASSMHVGLYLLMIVMPILGWLILSGAAKPIPFDLPALMAQNKELAKTLEGIHGTIGEVGYFLIGLHAAAALFHHYARKDNTLQRMLPWGDV